MRRKGFSLGADEGMYFHNDEDKIELVHCPEEYKECVKQLPDINRYFHESHQGRLDKDYLKAIEALKHAFDITYTIGEESCISCAEFFRSTIIDSMNMLHAELKELSSGWFHNKHYIPAFEKASRQLQEMNQKMRSLD